jgi:small basic protein
MIWILSSLALGVAVGYFVPFTYPIDYTIYVSVAILAIMDSVFGAVKSSFEDKFENIIFITGFLGNTLLAVIMTYIGEKLGVPLYYVAVLVFGMRIFDNFSIIRRYVIKTITNKE